IRLQVRWEVEDGWLAGANPRVCVVAERALSPGELAVVTERMQRVRGAGDRPPSPEGILVRGFWPHLRPTLDQLDPPLQAEAMRGAAGGANAPPPMQPADEAPTDEGVGTTAAGGSVDPGAPAAGSIRKDGANWVIEFGRERGSFPVKDYGAIDVLVKLLAN